MRMIIKEVPVENLTEALIAEKKGADRIELCGNLQIDGITPSYGMIKLCKKLLHIPVMVMIRPRGGNFQYSDQELDIMKEDIKVAKELGADGIVLGVLNKNQDIDMDAMKVLIGIARPLPITFHKAIDHCIDPIKNLEKLIALGIDRVLTSGQATTALAGRPIITKMMEVAGNRTQILVCGKITKEQLANVEKLIPAREYHGRLLVGPLFDH